MTSHSLIRSAFAALFACCIVTVAGSALAQPRSEIVRIEPPQPLEADGKIEVLEFFAYGCIHCNNIEPALAKWVKGLPPDVKFRRVPAGAGFEFRGINNPPLFYTLDAMGLTETLHAKALLAANKENVALGSPTVLREWLNKQGVDAAKFDAIQKSFSVQSKVNTALRMTQSYTVASTPFFVVDGRVGVTHIESPERLFLMLDQQIAGARARRLGVGPKL
jgi:protein dithiol oxidoreductase (disulfide-forming)